jgi:poly(3-hydroxybutyrate) depolymerase
MTINASQITSLAPFVCSAFFVMSTLVSGCGSDDPAAQPDTNTNGSSGTAGASGSATMGNGGSSSTSGNAGSGGSSGTGGNKATGGTGGTSGTSGSSGSAGNSGAAGSAGVAGTAGSGGSVGGSGGTAGTGGTSGTSGASGTAGTAGGNDGPSSSRHQARPIGSPYASQGYWEYLPPDYGTAPKPLMVFLHGVGENGTGSQADLAKVTVNGPPKLIKQDKWPNSRPFIVLSPQHPGTGCPSPDEVRNFLAFAMSNYTVDPKRVYLTGLSCGAIGSWDYVRKYLADHTIAALVPISGNGKSAWNTHMCGLGILPIWAFHGDKDTTVPPDGSTVPLNGLAMCTNPAPVDAKLTIYTGVGHSGWSQTYDLSAGHDIYAWMLSHVKP